MPNGDSPLSPSEFINSNPSVNGTQLLQVPSVHEEISDTAPIDVLLNPRYIQHFFSNVYNTSSILCNKILEFKA